jgi:hypothetical protein
MGRHQLALAADVRYRGHLPKEALGQRPDGIEALRDRAVGGFERALRRQIEPEPKWVGAQPALLQQALDQGIADPVEIASRARAIDDAVDTKCNPMTGSSPMSF